MRWWCLWRARPDRSEPSVDEGGTRTTVKDPTPAGFGSFTTRAVGRDESGLPQLVGVGVSAACA